jgi:hypothetical protein
VVSFGYAGLPKPHASNNRSVVIINETVARKLWPGQDPIGRTALVGGTEPQVIGVIANVRESGAEDNAGAISLAVYLDRRTLAQNHLILGK